MKKKVIKIIFIILIILSIFISKTNAFSMSNIINQGQEFISSANEEKISEENIKSLSDSIYNILQFIAVAVALIVIIVLGIKYMTGSVEEQAEIKKTMIPFIIGCIVAFGAFAIWKVVVNVLNNTNF